MNPTAALGLLRGLGTVAFTTSDAAALFRTSVPAASKILRRLAKAGLVTFLRRGVWTARDPVDPLALVEFLTAPHPGYVSLQTALHVHGMIEQIPSVIYVVSLSRSHRIRTPFGTYSIHRIAPEFFGGFDVSRSGAKVATPEKALLDVFYLSAGRSRLFASLPEVEIPAGFRWRDASTWSAKIASPRLKTIVRRRLEAFKSRGARGSV